MMNTHLMTSFILLLLSFFSSPSLAATSQRCNPNDYKVLMKIKESLNNPYHLASWVPKTDCCSWYCLQCDELTNRVNELTIFSGNISGQIPSSVGDLPYLKTLVFRKLTNITGSIPSSILKLKYLTMLRLSWNNLSGPIPDFLGQISSLDYLDLAFNQFSGSIPSSLSNLKYLRALHLDRNKLTGSIPESFANFNSSSIPDLYLSHNQLSGPIPKSLSNVDFSIIDLSRNKLEGDGSVLFNPERATTWIDLSRNLLEFDLTNVRFPVNITYLDLSHNKIRGMIPEQMKSLELNGLNVSYNRLCGQIPFGGKLQTFDNSSYFHNKCMCGSPLAAFGIDADDDRIELLLTQVKGKDITELIASGREKLASVPSGGGGAPMAVAATGGGGAAAPAASEKKEEKVEEKEESDDDMGFSLFD